jgi:hypothetical protein
MEENCPNLPLVFSWQWSGKKSTSFQFDSSLFPEEVPEPLDRLSTIEYLSTKQPIQENIIINVDGDELLSKQKSSPRAFVSLEAPRMFRLPKLVRESFASQILEKPIFRDNEEERPLVGAYLMSTNTARKIRRASL